VVAAAGSAAKRDLARELGADGVADYTQPGWAGQVLAITGPAGPQVVFDGVGGQIGRDAFAITAPGGRFSAHGTPGGGFAPIDERDAKQRQITVSGIEAAQFPPAEARQLTRRALAEAAAGLIRPVIGQTFPLERAVDAHRAIEARLVTGKTLLEVLA
jgi:NADPH:quinone reductase